MDFENHFPPFQGFSIKTFLEKGDFENLFPPFQGFSYQTHLVIRGFHNSRVFLSPKKLRIARTPCIVLLKKRKQIIPDVKFQIPGTDVMIKTFLLLKLHECSYSAKHKEFFWLIHVLLLRFFHGSWFRCRCLFQGFLHMNCSLEGLKFHWLLQTNEISFFLRLGTRQVQLSFVE